MVTREISPIVAYAVLTLLIAMLVLAVPAGARWRHAFWPSSMPPLSSHRPGDLFYAPRTPYWRAPQALHDPRRGAYFGQRARFSRIPTAREWH